MGTPAFMSPEQARGRWDQVDARSDLWAVGATMFALLSGRFVHRARTLNEQFLAAMTTVAPPIGSVLSGLAPEVATVIDRAIAFKPEDRWPDARAMQAAIRKAYAATRETGGAQSPASLRPPLTASRLSSAGRDDLEGMAPLDFGSPATPTIEQGVTNAPSAAPDARVVSPRRSPFYVGICAGALGVALALAALVRHPAASAPASIAAARAAIDVASSLAAQVTQADPPAAPLESPAGFEVASPPATGVPLSLVADIAPPPRRHTSPAPAPEPSASVSASTNAPVSAGVSASPGASAAVSEETPRTASSPAPGSSSPGSASVGSAPLGPASP